VKTKRERRNNNDHNNNTSCDNINKRGRGREKNDKVRRKRRSVFIKKSIKIINEYLSKLFLSSIIIIINKFY